MTSVPTSFLFSAALVLVLVWVIKRFGKRTGFFPKLTLGLIALQSVLIGLRWTYDFHEALLIQATLAALLPPFVLMSMRQMASTRAAREPVERILLFCIPAVIVMISPILNFPYVDWVIHGVFVGFGATLVYLGLTADNEWRDRVPFEGVMEANLAFVVAGCALLMSAAVDIAVSYDLTQTGGQFAPQIVGLANLVVLLCLAIGVLMLSNRANAETPGAEPEPLQLSSDTSVEAAEMAEQLSALLKKMDKAIIERKLYRDPDLSLNRLSRKLLIPTRQISLAVNSQRAINLSQYINLFRIAEAAYLLKTGKMPITEVIYEVGFNTKSNFNREFKRLVGMSPSEWRKGCRSSEDSLMRSFSAELADTASWEPAQSFAVNA